MTASRKDDRISFGVQTRARVDELAGSGRAIEAAGFDRVLVADHPGLTSDPFVALAAIAAVTDRVRLGTYVLNAGVRAPWQVASAAASLHALSRGRFELGLGAGHTPSEWRLAGLRQPPPGSRITRLGEAVELIRALLEGGPVDFDGELFACHNAQLLDGPAEIPLLIGGNGPRLLALAARHAHVVAMTGFGATQSDGHTHAVRWSPDALSRSMNVLRQAEQASGTQPEREVLVQHLEVTSHREAAARRFIAAGVEGLDLETALNTPFVLLGSPAEIVTQLEHWRATYGITRYVIRDDVLRAGTEVLRTLG